MKKINILYWIFTGLFAVIMISTSIPNITVTEQSVEVIGGLGYPRYIIPFLGVAKVLGAIAIMVPGFPRLKEWAYAGLFFDLLGATYSALMVHEPDPAMAGMLIFFGPGALSYIFYHKRRKMQEAVAQQTVPVSA